MPIDVNNHLTEVRIAWPDTLHSHSIAILRTDIQFHVDFFHSKVPTTSRIFVPVHNLVRHIDEVHVINHLLAPPLIALTEMHLLEVRLRCHTTLACVVVVMHCSVVTHTSSLTTLRCLYTLLFFTSTWNLYARESFFYELNECCAECFIISRNSICNRLSNIY